MRFYRYLAVVFAVMLFAGCTTQGTKRSSDRFPGSLYQTLAMSGCRVITIPELTASLPRVAISVGFDIDDTVLFSSPAFYYAMTNTDGPCSANRYGDHPLKSNQFWTDLSTDLDKFSIPKKIAFEIINIHKSRGDTIYFITARHRPDTGAKPLTNRLNHIFDLSNLHEVVFTNEQPKTATLREKNIRIYYGDSDGDMRDARSANIRPIRIVRSLLSTKSSTTNYGAFQEEVIYNSHY
ncbi:MAG TPA: class B acid phosphatase [bacterium]|nr:class B acid phosphatase [bacterium]